VVRQSVDKLATGIAASQERLTRSLDRIAAGQEQITRSVDKIAASIAANQEQITHSVDRIAASGAIAGAAVGGPTSTPLMLPWEAPAFVAVKGIVHTRHRQGPRLDRRASARARRNVGTSWFTNCALPTIVPHDATR